MVCILLCLAPARAGVVAFNTPNTVGGPYNNTPPLSLADFFTPNTDIAVTALGFYYGAGLNGQTSEVVGIFDTSKNLLVSTTVTTAGTLIDGYYYQSIAPITLNSGTEYAVVSYSANGWWYAIGAPNEPTTSSQISFTVDPTLRLQTGYNFGGSLAYPDSQYYYSDYMGPNFQIGGGSAPEPGSRALFSLGLFLLGLRYTVARPRGRRDRIRGVS